MEPQVDGGTKPDRGALPDPGYMHHWWQGGVCVHCGRGWSVQGRREPCDGAPR